MRNSPLHEYRGRLAAFSRHAVERHRIVENIVRRKAARRDDREPICNVLTGRFTHDTRLQVPYVHEQIHLPGSASTSGAGCLDTHVPARGPGRPARQRRRPMLGPVMNSGSTDNADISPADDGMQPDLGLFSRNVHIRDLRTGLPDTGSYTVAGAVFGRSPRSAVSPHVGEIRPSPRRRPSCGPAPDVRSVASPPADSKGAARFGSRPIRAVAHRSVLPMMHSSRNDGGFYDEDRI